MTSTSIILTRKVVRIRLGSYLLLSFYLFLSLSCRRLGVKVALYPSACLLCSIMDATTLSQSFIEVLSDFYFLFVLVVALMWNL